MTGTDDSSIPMKPSRSVRRSPRVLLRRADYKSLDSLTLLSRLAFPHDEAIKVSEWAQYVLREGRIVQILRRASETIGYVSASVRRTEVRLHQLCVAYDYRRRGYGKRLLEYLKERAEEVGRLRITGAVRETNLAAQLFLKSQGFTCYRIVQGWRDSSNGYYLFRYDAASIEIEKKQ